MKKVLLILLCVLGIIKVATADTIDYCHVYYNKVKIHEFNQIGTKEIILEIDSIKTGDSLTIKYFKDTPCFNCRLF